MPEKRKRRVTAAQKAARARNIIQFNTTREQAPAQKHGCQSASVKAGKLPAGFEELQSVLDSFHAGWVSDLGGDENLTSAKRALLWISRGSLAVFALGLEYIKTHGLVDAEGNVAAVAKVLATYGNSVRLNLAAAGLERVPRTIAKTLEATMAEIAEREHSETNIEKTDETIEKD